MTVDIGSSGLSRPAGERAPGKKSKNAGSLYVELRRIATADEAIAAIGDVVGAVRQGGTNIQAALLKSFAIVKGARERDPDLGRAQIVLVTDGKSPIDPDAVDEARRSAGAAAIGLSVIALGSENAALRTLVARQRSAGERAFYHFVSDATLTGLVSGEATSWLGALHITAGRAQASATDLARSAIGDALVELADLEEGRHREMLGREGSSSDEGELGRGEAVRASIAPSRDGSCAGSATVPRPGGASSCGPPRRRATSTPSGWRWARSPRCLPSWGAATRRA